MTDYTYHKKIAEEQREVAIDGHRATRYSAVGHMAFMAAEQAVEAAASLEGQHFHERPRDAHAQRIAWLEKKFPKLADKLKRLWDIRSELGYGGKDGEKSSEAIRVMEEIFDELRVRKPSK